jgi:hypothetical protein
LHQASHILTTVQFSGISLSLQAFAFAFCPWRNFILSGGYSYCQQPFVASFYFVFTRDRCR